MSRRPKPPPSPRTQRAGHHVDRGLGTGTGGNRGQSSAASVLRSGHSTPPIGIAVRVHDLIAAVQDRSAAYSWPPAARAFTQGQRPQLTRRGWRVFYQYRQQFRRVIDIRAIEVEVARHAELFATNNDPPAVTAEGLTITEFAQLAGIDRGRVSRNLVEIPTGPAPTLPPGKVPARRIGETRRIFRSDFLGEPRKNGADHGSTHTQTASDSASREDWRGSLDRLRHQGPPEG